MSSIATGAHAGSPSGPRDADRGQNRVLIHGLGRSGTSWLMKIFDHHPMVFASHEPERYATVPRLGEVSADEARLRVGCYVEHLFAARPLRAMRKRPLQRKAYRSRFMHELRRALLYGLSGAQRLLPGAGARLAGLHVPTLADLGGATMVLKCVSHQLLVPWIAKYAPELKVIVLIRHPCGNTHSNLAGQRKNAMSVHYLPPRARMDEMFALERPAHELTEADFSQTEILAYRWAVYNDPLYRAATVHENLRVLRYEDLCADPIAQSRALFDWVGLPWHPSSETFLRASLSMDRDASGYHKLTRNPAIAATKWRTQMAPKDIDRVLEICSRSSAFALYRATEDDVPAREAAG